MKCVEIEIQSTSRPGAFMLVTENVGGAGYMSDVLFTNILYRLEHPSSTSMQPLVAYTARYTFQYVGSTPLGHLTKMILG